MNGKSKTAARLIGSYVTTCGLCCAPMILTAQEASETTSEALDEIIVTATRLESELGRTPAAVSVVVEDGRAIESLRHEKDDIREARAGTECGIKLAGYDDIKEGDILEFYQQTEVARTL